MKTLKFDFALVCIAGRLEVLLLIAGKPQTRAGYLQNSGDKPRIIFSYLLHRLRGVGRLNSSRDTERNSAEKTYDTPV